MQRRSGAETIQTSSSSRTLVRMRIDGVRKPRAPRVLVAQEQRKRSKVRITRREGVVAARR
jgi:hypothetical protein